MEIWLHYYNKRDPSARPLGRVRVYKYGAIWAISRGAYRRIMEKIHTYDRKGIAGFIGPSGTLGQPVSLTTWKIKPDGSTDVDSTFITNIGSVF